MLRLSVVGDSQTNEALYHVVVVVVVEVEFQPVCMLYIV
jgi:hypothetical protein